MTHPSTQSRARSHDRGRLDDLVREAAESSIVTVSRCATFPVGCAGPSRLLARACLEYSLSREPGTGPDRLSAEIRQSLVSLADASSELPSETVAVAIHHAFVHAVRFVTRRAADAAVGTSLVKQWSETMRTLEALLVDALVVVAAEARTAHELRARCTQARLLASVLRDPAVESAAAQSSIGIGSDASRVVLPSLPPWAIEAADTIPVLVRGRGAAWGTPMTTALPLVDELPEGCLAALGEFESIVLLPAHDSTARIAALDGLFEASDIVVGLPVPLPDVPLSLAWCRRALALYDGPEFEVPTRRNNPALIDCADLTIQLLVSADPALLRHHASSIFRPFDGVRGYRRTVLLETLSAWALHHRAGIPAVARELGRHPQTIRYRMRQLRALMGEVLDDEQHMLLTALVLSLYRSSRHTPLEAESGDQ